MLTPAALQSSGFPGSVASALTRVASLAVYAFFWDVANGPVPIHKEAVAERVTEPLHSRRHASAGRQADLAGAAQENALSQEIQFREDG